MLLDASVVKMKIFGRLDLTLVRSSISSVFSVAWCQFSRMLLFDTDIIHIVN